MKRIFLLACSVALLVFGFAVGLWPIVNELRSQTMTDRRSLRVFASGPSECGKSQLLATEFTSRTPRVISIDITGETALRNPDAIQTFGLAELRDALRRAASFRKWHIVASLDENELEPTFEMLTPRPKSIDDVSFPRAVGGIAIECGECAYLAPNGRTANPVRGAFLRGRHHLLSLYMAAQRPANVDRAVTANSEILIAFGHREDADLSFWSKTTSAAIARIIEDLPQYHSIYYPRASGRVYVRDGAYKPYRVLDPRGRELSRDLKLVRQS